MTKKRGRPTLYKAEHCELARKLCARLGATDEDLAAVFGVSIDTIYEWKKTHSEFSEAVKAGKDDPDQRVENSLFQRAVGYSRTIEKTTVGGEVVKLTEEVPGDTTAQIFWLKNRRPKQWRDKQEIEHKGAVFKVTVREKKAK